MLRLLMTSMLYYMLGEGDVGRNGELFEEKLEGPEERKTEQI